MNILFVLYIGFDTHGPSVHLLTEIIEQSLIAGHNVNMIVRNRGGENPDIPVELQKYDNLHCDIIYDSKLEKGALVKRYFEDILYAFKCRKIYKKYKNTDVVFLQSHTSPLFSVTLLKRTLKKPILFNVQNIFPIDANVLGKLPETGIKGIVYKVFRKMQQLAYKKADRLVTISGDMKEVLLGEKVPENKLDVVHNWSYSDDILDIPDDENITIKALNIDKSKYKVVFAGNLGAMVDANLIADAAEFLKDEKDIHFYIIGGGNNMQVLKDLAAEKQLENMSFFGYLPIEHAPHNYAMANVNINALPKKIITTCMPSKTAIMLNSARPMVVAVEKDSHYAKMLSEVDKCIVVDVGDSKGFANAILNFYNNRVTDSSENSREIFAKHCSKDNAKKYVEILESMVK